MELWSPNFLVQFHGFRFLVSRRFLAVGTQRVAILGTPAQTLSWLSVHTH